MKLNGKDANRRLEVWQDGIGFLLIEKLRRVPTGYTKAKWEDERIWLSAEEVRKLAAFVQAEPKEGKNG